MKIPNGRIDGRIGLNAVAATAFAAALALQPALAAAPTPISGATPFPSPGGPCDNELLGGPST